MIIKRYALEETSEPQFVEMTKTAFIKHFGISIYLNSKAPGQMLFEEHLYIWAPYFEGQHTEKRQLLLIKDDQEVTDWAAYKYIGSALKMDGTALHLLELK